MTSRSPRKTTNGLIDHDVLLAAIKQIKIEKKSIRSAALDFNIPRPSLQRYVKKFDENCVNIDLFNDNQLLDLVKSIAGYATPKQVNHENS